MDRLDGMTRQTERFETWMGFEKGDKGALLSGVEIRRDEIDTDVAERELSEFGPSAIDEKTDVGGDGLDRGEAFDGENF